MKHYYKFSINYDDDFAIHSVNQELKKGDVVVIPVYADEFAIGIVVEPISELKALTECGEVEDVITVVNTKPYTDKQKARIKRKQLHLLMKERLDEFKEIDTFRKIADKDPAFRTLYEAYQKTELSNDEQLTCDDVSETLNEEQAVIEWEEFSSHSPQLLKGENMNYLSMKAILELMATKSYKELIKAILSFETNVEDEMILEKVYEFYFNEDNVTLLNEELKERIQHEKQVLSKN